MDEKDCIKSLISVLNKTYGTISWWDAPFDEVAIGAILTQQTRWENVEAALTRLRSAGLNTLAAITTADPADLESCIRCTGFYRVKSARLRRLASFILEEYDEKNRIDQIPTDVLRRSLLTVNGVGEETADSILCYGLHRKTFVIDAYTRRICTCAGISLPDNQLRHFFISALGSNTRLLRSCHGQIVEYAKEYCSKKRCQECRIRILHE
ncbi:MAG: HhH-GPD family protein [Methanomicrobiales archaeon 53_19]|uniref:endonuclease III domain-containing protein n=1 Tax=Methanocalculus sp. TaxID=2004547 RepID=UPI000746DDC5|nr:Fe-S cluster assembly protein HesB [Methanocalculus sp.]KUK71202.1 MAG: HhH-GPD family protein [Methanocalculus sp. 52_23]KUL04745.1 MAG: HhH-GPD family protein [Methanomicrobiales archaeon 53_19]HIJ06961.1 Fe-S cluster assembly protein HesB [Methanocalculus sp.]